MNNDPRQSKLTPEEMIQETLGFIILVALGTPLALVLAILLAEVACG